MKLDISPFLFIVFNTYILNSNKTIGIIVMPNSLRNIKDNENS